jgi:hypothetical protein
LCPYAETGALYHGENDVMPSQPIGTTAARRFH